MNYEMREKYEVLGQPEYDIGFWDFMYGNLKSKFDIGKYSGIAKSGYALPATSNKKYIVNVKEKSIFRNIATVNLRYNPNTSLWLYTDDEITSFVGENEELPIKDLAQDLTRERVNSYKIAALFKVANDMKVDLGANFEDFMLKKLAKCFGRTEDKAYITGTGVKEPTGILHDTDGAEIGVSANSLTYDDVINLYFSVKPEYRENGVWLMNDETALALRTLKDDAGNYLWRNTDDTILGKKVLISEFMPNATSGNKPISFGDFSYYWIIERSPVGVTALHERFAIQDQTGYIATEFLDGRLIRKDAVKVLEITE